MELDPKDVRLKGLTRREALSLFGATSAGLAIAACTPGGSTSGSQGAGTGVAVYGEGAEPLHIDPAQATLAGESSVVDNLYDSLFAVEGFPPQRKNRLAEGFTVSPDGKQFDFHIRNDVVFHDGTKLTASDVVYSFSRLLQLQGGPSSIWQGIVTPDMLSAPDSTTFRVSMASPYAPLPDTLAWLYVVNQKLVEAHAAGRDFGSAWVDLNDAGSGPFTLASLQKGTQLNFNRFAKYWRGWQSSYLDGWIYKVIREPATVRLGLQDGSISLADLFTLTTDDLSAATNGGNVATESHPGLSVVSIKMNNQRYPTNNKLFRKAVSYAFNYDAVIKDLLKGQTQRQYGAYPAGFRFFKDFKGTSQAYDTNLDKARSFLQQSGVDPKAIGKLGYLYRGDDATQQNYGLILKSSLAQIGIEVELQGVSISVLLADLVDPRVTPNFSRISNSALIIDPDLYCRQYLLSTEWEGGKGKWYTATYYKNPAVDQLINAAKFEPDQTKRATMYGQLQDTVYDDAADVWVDQQNWLVDRRATLKGYTYDGLGAYPLNFWPMYFNPPQKST